MAADDSDDRTDLFVAAMHGRARALADSERITAARLRELQSAVREVVDALAGIDVPRVKKCRERLETALQVKDAATRTRRN